MNAMKGEPCCTLGSGIGQLRLKASSPLDTKDRSALLTRDVRLIFVAQFNLQRKGSLPRTRVDYFWNTIVLCTDRTFPLYHSGIRESARLVKCIGRGRPRVYVTSICPNNRSDLMLDGLCTNDCSICVPSIFYFLIFCLALLNFSCIGRFRKSE